MSPLVLLLLQTPSIDRLDALAQARDVAGLTQYLQDPAAKTADGVNPFRILKTNGGYAAGQMGWHAKLLEPKDGTAKYVVFSTPIIVEDYGELLFRIEAGGKLTFIPERDGFGMEMRHHEFNVSFDLPAHAVDVTDTFTCKWTSPPRPHFLFRMSPTLKVASMSTPDGKPIPFVQAGGITAVSSNRSGQFTVRYSGTLEKPGFERQIGPSEATLSGSMWYPMIARHPSTYGMTMMTPPNWIALAQGDEGPVLGAQEPDALKLARFDMKVPVVWFSATMGPYRKVTTRINGIDFSTISPTASDDAMRKQNEFNSQVIDFYSKTFSPYPFKSWTTVDSTQFQNGVGALEAYSFATYPAGGVPFRDSHEPGHTWWGGLINNDYLASIWNESFTDYSQEMFVDDQPYGNREDRRRAFLSPGAYTPDFDAASLARSGQDIGRPATTLGYVKGAYVLRVLEDELGSDTFIRCLRDWLRTNPVGHVGSWEDFEAVCDRVAGRDLTWFFDEWVRGKGLPDCSLTNVAWASGRVTGTVAFNGPVYRMDLDAALTYPDGRLTFARLAIDPANGGRFTIDCRSKPSSVSLDPFSKVTRRHMGRFAGESISRVSHDRVYLDPATHGYLKSLVGSTPSSTIPSSLDGSWIVGNPDTTPALVPLLTQVGFKVSGNRLTYDGTTIDLTKGGAVAVVDLPDGKHCVIGLGTCDTHVTFGRARLALFDSEGHILRAFTAPVDNGPMAAKP